jgi:hypothetical protein
MTRSQMAFIRGILGSVVMIRRPSALNTSANAAVNDSSLCQGVRILDGTAGVAITL